MEKHPDTSFLPAELIAYQDGSVVSREILKKSVGSITVFAFEAGEGLSEHTSPYDAVIYNLEGRAEITIAGKIHPLESGQMIVMPANKPHALKAASRFKMMLIMIRGTE